MTLVMAYVILIAASISACAVVLESVARSRGRAVRWVWVSALGLTALTTVLAMVVPSQGVSEGRELLIGGPIVASSEGVAKILPVQSAAVDWETLFQTGDTMLPPAWVLASIVLLIAIGVGQRRLRRERARSRAAELAGHRVLLTEATGPAVAGIREPVVFVPRWVLALDEPSQVLLLTHEVEHVKQRDTAVLFSGALAVAVMPWNPVVWWMVRRLRLAVEQDCDARVLARHPGVRRYADLLLMAASRHGLTSRLLAAHFGEHTSDLMRRIEAMTSRERFPWRRIAGATLVASALIAAACETPRPDPVAPLPVRAPVSAAPQAAESSERTAEFSKQRERCTVAGGAGCQISVIVLASDGKELARYAGEIPVAHVPEGGIHMINVEQGACGTSSCSLIWIRLKPDVSLDGKGDREIEVVKDRLNYKVQERKALLRSDRSDTVEIIDDKQRRGLTSATLIERDGNRVANGRGFVSWPPPVLIRRIAPAEMPNIIVRRSDGSELKRFIADRSRPSAKSPFDEIPADDIESIEVQKGTRCEPLACPLVQVTLKPGRDASYRKP